jgi:predicted ATPase
VGGIVGNALGANIDNKEASPQALVEVIGRRQLLLLLDNCEHLIGPVAELVEYVARIAPNVRILATSREPLGADGEQVYAVPPLDVGDIDDGSLGGTEALGRETEASNSSAVTLFLARIRALTSDVPTDPHTMKLMRLICKQLDGIPLAIEIAAARVPMLGIEQLSALLYDRFHLLTESRRTSLPRHRTLKAALDWSFDLLDATEQMVLCSLGVFAGGFTLDAALAICPSGMAPLVVIDTVTTLVRKSLIVVDVGRAGARYRLLEITRSYAAERLFQRGGWNEVARRHLVFFSKLLRTSVPDPGPDQREPRLAYFRRELDNVRAALEWAFHDGKELALGISLTALATPLMYDLLQVEECAALAERALREITRDSKRDLRDETQLLIVKAAAIAYTDGPTEEVAAVWEQVIGHALELDDATLEMRGVWGIWNQKVYAGRPAASIPFAQRLPSTTATAAGRHDEAFGLQLHRKLGTSLHFLGDQRGARFHLEKIAAGFDSTVHFVKSVGGRIDHGYASRITLARVLWLQGLFDQAISLNERNVLEAESTLYPLLACYSLLDATIPLALMRGQWEDAGRSCDELNKRLAITRLPIWEACAACFVEMVAIGSGSGRVRLPLLLSKIQRLRRTNYLVHLSMIQGFAAEQLGACGRHVEGLALVEEALSDSSRRGERWYAAELQHIRGKLILRCGGQSALQRAEHCFTRAIEIAKSQGALCWELRATTSSANLLREEGHGTAAGELLENVYRRFTEGFNTAELVAAQTRLGCLG